MNALVKGTDVSAIQGDITDADWKAMADFGVRFAIMRLLVGNETWTDQATVRKNVQRARAHGIHCGAYFFPYPLPHLKPKDQIDRFVKLLEGLGMNPGDVPPAYDMEWPPREEKAKDGTIVYPWKKWGCTRDQLVQWHLEALDYGEALTEIDWLVYSYRYHLQCLESEKVPDFAKRKLWLADYFAAGRWPSVDEAAKRKAPGPWTEITIIQHDGDGGLRMPNGRDADFNVFLGDEAELVELCAGKGVAPSLPDTINDFDPVVAHMQANALMLEDQIAEYRRQRIDAALEAA